MKYTLTIALRRRVADVAWRREYYRQMKVQKVTHKYSMNQLEEMWNQHKHLEHAREAYGQVFK